MIIDNVRLYDAKEYVELDKVYHLKLGEGKVQEIREGRTQEEGTGVVDGMERVLTPAFHDTHMHFLRYGLMKKELDLRHVSTWEHMKEEIRTYYPQMEEGDWVVGRGLNDGEFTDRTDLLQARDLDDIHLHTYMFFLHQDGHECVVNHKVMDLLKKEEEFKEIPDDFKEKDDNGEWTGRFKDTAVHFIKHHFRKRTMEDAREALESGIPYLLKNGITTIHTDDLNFIGSYSRLWEAYQSLEKEGKLPIRAYLHHYIFKKKHLEDYLDNHPFRTGEGSDRVKVGAVKIFLDGTQRLHTSAMRVPYHDKKETTGNAVYTQNELNDILRLAGSNRMQVAMHAIGDRAVEQAITALEQPEAKTAQLRHRIIHAQTVGEDLLKRLEHLGAVIETQPSFLLTEWDKKEKWVGKDLVPYCDAFKSFNRHHIPFTLSSDLPIGSLNPFEGIFAAVNRTDLKGKPSGGWQPQEKLTVNEAFRGYTSVPTLIELNEMNNHGRLMTGERADFLLLDQHPLEVEKSRLHEIGVVETWFSGEKVFEREAE
ncbi:amidohydrolase [Rossellomorea aquimaris]|uniref:amidohydrolase n=1 Tax=Rossellomorea aquimaris TaxID=189382 RepID=UPI001CD57AF5|nr:amidohydrolase [Rossellomorea aquimaris]MCA1053941.1 amidohydrolase [Rossellomorea aquimaris]